MTQVQVNVVDCPTCPGPTGYSAILLIQGATGPAGPPGTTGPVGATGPVGPVGPAGVTGATGVQGVTGPMGATGAPAPYQQQLTWHCMFQAGEGVPTAFYAEWDGYLDRRTQVPVCFGFNHPTELSDMTVRLVRVPINIGGTMGVGTAPRTVVFNVRKNEVDTGVAAVLLQGATEGSMTGSVQFGPGDRFSIWASPTGGTVPALITPEIVTTFRSI